MDLVGLLASHPVVAHLAAQMVRAPRGTNLVARGSAGSSTALLAGALSRLTDRAVLLVVAHTDDAEEAADELAGFGVEPVRFPALQVLPGESGVALDLLGERLALVERAGTLGAAAPAGGRVIVAPIQALMQLTPPPGALARVLLTLEAARRPEGIGPGPAGLGRWLDEAGYRRVETVEEPGDFAVRGGIVDVFPPGDPAAAGPERPDGLPVSFGGAPVRLDYFGDEIEKIHEIDPETMGVDRRLGAVRLVCARPEAVDRLATTGIIDLLPDSTPVVLHELMEITEQGRGYFERVVAGKGVVGPPAVFQALRRLGACVEVTAIGAYGAGPGGPLVELPVSNPPAFDADVGKAIAELGSLALGRGAERARVRVLCLNEGERSRLGELIEQFAPEAAPKIDTFVAYLHQGFAWRGADGDSEILVPYHELLHRATARRRAGGARLRGGRALDTFVELEVGDYVVHADHGIALFTGLKMMRPLEARRSADEVLRAHTGPARTSPRRGAPLPAAGGARAASPAPTRADDEALEEYLTLQFDGGSVLHVPAVRIDQVQKYVGGFKGKPPLSVLGGARWANQKARVAESVRDLAAQMLRIRAAREHLPGIRYPADTPWQKEFEAEFPYDETEDQLAALAEIKRDMQRPRPMDRLLCGDVGYGKTELAIRAAFKAVEYGKQAAVLVPTTVLAEQHERTFAGRFRDYPFRVASLSRFKTDAEIRATLEELAAGRVDVIIGTHRLLSKDVRFADLGLVIIDEEQRFGVEHKERLLALRMTVDVLTLSATPIPRTLHMSMLGLRDISSLATAPTDRRAVVTEVVPPNPARIQQVIRRELARQGQVFYVHNRVHDILSVADDVRRLVPEARIVVGHGQMADGELERVMLAFMRREADILVSTTIIESGIDIPTANTMIIADADRFGLADLHQLRGRVGRSSQRAYCYLLLPESRPLKENARQRLLAIEQFSMLGAGFKIAMRDLEIRGAGNLLGAEQSGHIAAVGYDMYCRLLDRAVKQLRNEATAAPSETSVEIGVRAVIPKAYIPSDRRRLEAYRRLAVAETAEELARVERDLANAYGPLPDPVQRLIGLAAVRVGARLVGVRSIFVRERDVILRTADGPATVERFTGAPGKATLLPSASPDQPAEVYYRPDNPAGLEPRTLLTVLRARLAALGVAAEPAERAADLPSAPAMPPVRVGPPPSRPGPRAAPTIARPRDQGRSGR